MNERQQDWEWLRDFARNGDQAAFAAVVRRHLNLVYATALRKLEDTGGAEEVAQNVFAVLARKAWQFAPDDSLPAWLHRTALLEASAWLRSELRRRRREQTAAELGTSMKTPDQEPALCELLPMLDEGLLTLPEKDRTVLLLRYYESRPLREVGAVLGISEDAARKRVGTALELVSRFFRRRGFQTVTVAAITATLQNAATAAPPTVVAAISQSALQAVPPALAGLTGLLGRLASLTKIQTAALCVALTVVPGTWKWQQSQRAREDATAAQQLLHQTRTLETQLGSRLEHLRSESTRLDAELTKADQARPLQEETATKIKAFKKRLFGLLTTTDYRWPDDLPFVRIPKSALKDLQPGRSIDRELKIQDWGAELLALTPEEKLRAEEALLANTESLAQSAADRAYQTNYLPPSLATVWAGKTYLSIWVPPPADDSPALMDSLLASVGQVVGNNRAGLLLGANANATAYSQSLDDLAKTQKGVLFTVCVDPTHPGDVEWGQYSDGSGGSTSGSPTEMHLTLPKSIVTRFYIPWMQKQLGYTNTMRKANP